MVKYGVSSMNWKFDLCSGWIIAMLLSCYIILDPDTVVNGLWRLWIFCLTHLPLVPHINASVNCVSIASGNGLSPVRRQAFTWINDNSLPIGPLGRNFSEIQIKIQNFSFMKMHLKMSSAKWRPLCRGGGGVGVVESTLCLQWKCCITWQPHSYILHRSTTESTKYTTKLRYKIIRIRQLTLWCQAG